MVNTSGLWPRPWLSHQVGSEAGFNNGPIEVESRPAMFSGVNDTAARARSWLAVLSGGALVGIAFGVACMAVALPISSTPLSTLLFGVPSRAVRSSSIMRRSLHHRAPISSSATSPGLGHGHTSGHRGASGNHGTTSPGNTPAGGSLAFEPSSMPWLIPTPTNGGTTSNNSFWKASLCVIPLGAFVLSRLARGLSAKARNAERKVLHGDAQLSQHPSFAMLAVSETPSVSTAVENQSRIEHLIYPATLPSGGAHGLSVLSYNVLLPNSKDGWWTYKMYNPPLSPELQHLSEWDSRRRLLKERIQKIGADVVCLQETSPESFEEDFRFMREELGYDGCEVFKKGRFRPATFWRTDRCRLVGAPMHKDRTLLTTFQVGEGAADRNWHVLNCHLQAGKQGPRRARQILEGVKASVTQARKLKEQDPTSPLLIVCGDFNGGEECGAVRFLEDGVIGPEFLEDGEPVTSKMKSIPTSEVLTDVVSLIERPAPPTMVVSELISLMVEGSDSTAYDKPKLSSECRARLERIYRRFATQQHPTTGSLQMCSKDVEQWLIAINGQVGRGSEFRYAAREMGWKPPPDSAEGARPDVTLPENGVLPLEGFLQVYQEELTAGKFWGIAHDLSVLGEALPDIGLFTARFDRMYCSSSVRPAAVLDTTSEVACPNAVEPSDHLPVAAMFQVS